MKRFLFLVAFFWTVTLFSYNLVFAQQNNSDPGFNFQLDNSIGGFVYLDPLAGLIGSQFITYESSYNIANYELGPSDIISVNLNSSEPVLLRGLIINPEGKIVTPVLGQVTLNGLTLSEAEEKIKEVALKIFKNLDVNVTLEKPRPTFVFINGDVPYAGKHLVKPFSRLDEAIYPALNQLEIDPVTNQPVLFTSTSDLLNSGPYSFRNIQLIRNQSDTSVFDLYAFFKAGDLYNNPFIKNGDQIIFNKLDANSPKISLSGAVSNSIEIEFNRNDTPELLIKIAGGLKGDASNKELFVYRTLTNTIEKVTVEKSGWKNFELMPNDRIVVPRQGGYNNNSVAHIYGEVRLPGTFPIISGATNVSELIDFANGLTPDALVSAAYLSRAGSIENQIANEFNIESMKRTSDQLQQGFSYLELETRNSRSRVYLDLANEKELQTIKLYNGDQLFIPLDEQTVFIFGQVNTPGFYPYNSSLSISNYIDRAGGFALSADRNRIFILKAGNNTWYKPSETKLESGDKIFIDRTPFDELNSLRTYEIQKEQLKNNRIQLVMTGLTTITGIITTLVAIDVIKR